MSTSRTYRFLTLAEAVKYAGVDEKTIREKCNVASGSMSKTEYVNERELIEQLGLKDK